MKNENLSRRTFLKSAGAMAAAAALAPYLAGCGDGKETTSTAAVGSTASTITAAGLTSAAIAEKYGSHTIGDSLHTLQLGILKSWAEAADDAAKRLGQKHVVYENNVNTAKQTSDVESAVQAGNAALVTIPIDAPMAQVINGICEPAKVYFTTYNQNPPWWTPLDAGDYFVGLYTPDDFLSGYKFATALFEHLGGKGKVVHLSGSPGATATTMRDAGIKKALEEHPGIQVLDSKPTDWTVVTSQKLMENFLVAYPQIDGVLAENDDIGIGAHNAIRDAGKEIPIVGADGAEECIKLIRDSFFLATYATVNHWSGGWPFVKLFDAINGWKPNLPERLMYQGGTVVTKENATQYYDAFWGGNGLPYDWVKMSRVLSPDDWDPQNELLPINPEEWWKDIPKSSGYTLPAAYKDADFEGVRRMYDEHWKMRLFT